MSRVLRRPQGTFSSQNATSGAVIVNTNNPVIGGGYDGYVYARYGNYNDAGVQGAVNLPINDTLAARLAFNTEYSNSFYHVTGPWTGDPDLKWGSGRLSFLWTPTSSLKVLWKTDYDFLYGNYFGDAIVLTGKVNPTSGLFNFGNNTHDYAGDAFVQVDRAGRLHHRLRHRFPVRHRLSAGQDDLAGRYRRSGLHPVRRSCPTTRSTSR